MKNNIKIIKIISPSYEEIKELSNKYNISISILMESFDLEQYPYFKIINKNVWTMVIDIPIFSKSVSLFSVPVQIVMTKEDIILITKFKNDEISEIEKNIIMNDNKDLLFINILNYGIDLFLLKLKEIKKNIDIIMHEVYINNNYDYKYEKEISKLKIELVHYISSLNTNNMVLKQSVDLLESNNSSVVFEHESMIIDSTQAHDIAKLYLKLTDNLLQSFELYESRKVQKRVDKLTILTISLTIPNIIFGYFGMNVNIPLQKSNNIWLYISLFTLLISILIYFIDNKKK